MSDTRLFKVETLGGEMVVIADNDAHANLKVREYLREVLGNRLDVFETMRETYITEMEETGSVEGVWQ